MKKTLSPREQQVYDLYAQSPDRTAIAKGLGLSVKTVNTYLEKCRIKMDLDSTKALRIAARAA